MSVPQPPHESGARLARQAREQFVARAQQAVAPMVQAIKSRLSELVDNSGSSREMHERRDAMLEFERNGPMWGQATVKAWQKAVVPPTATTRIRLESGGLELIGDDVVERKIVSGRLALMIGEKTTWELNDLRLRMQFLDGEEMSGTDILRPEALAQLLVEQWGSSELSRECWTLIQDVVQKHLVEHVPEAYKATNEFLINQGVMRDIDLSTRVKRGASGPAAKRPAKAVDAAPQPEAPATGDTDPGGGGGYGGQAAGGQGGYGAGQGGYAGGQGGPPGAQGGYASGPGGQGGQGGYAPDQGGYGGGAGSGFGGPQGGGYGGAPGGGGPGGGPGGGQGGGQGVGYGGGQGGYGGGQGGQAGYAGAPGGYGGGEGQPAGGGHRGYGNGGAQGGGPGGHGQGTGGYSQGGHGGYPEGAGQGGYAPGGQAGQGGGYGAQGGGAPGGGGQGGYAGVQGSPGGYAPGGPGGQGQGVQGGYAPAGQGGQGGYAPAGQAGPGGYAPGQAGAGGYAPGGPGGGVQGGANGYPQGGNGNYTGGQYPDGGGSRGRTGPGGQARGADSGPGGPPTRHGAETRAGVSDETRMMTSSPPLARARARASGVLGQLKRLLTDRVAGFESNPPSHPSPALAEALSHQVTQVQATEVQGGPGGTGSDEILVYDDAAVQQVAVDLRRRTGELKKKAATSNEKATIEIVALMFQSILSEERIPAAVRVWFARLQMPVLRVAISEPEFFGSLEHPARQLIDRLGSCVMGFDSAAINGSALEVEIKRVVQVIEQYPETGRRVFQLVYEEFQKFLGKFLTESAPTQRVVSVAQQVEQKETLAIQYTIEMRSMLADMPVRDEIREFLFKVWAEVLALSAVKNGPQHEDTLSLKGCASELVWAASAKPNRGERAKVIQDLPKLLQRLRQGMSLVNIQGKAQEAHIKIIGDTLADAFLSKTEAIPHERIDEMAKRLAHLEDFVTGDPETDLPLDAESIEMMLGIDASNIEVIADGGSRPNAAMLAWAAELQLGNWFSLDHNGATTQVQYVWCSDRKQLHLFAAPGGRSYLVQARRLAAYLQAGLLLPAEEEALTVRATRDALAKLDANPERLLQ